MSPRICNIINNILIILMVYVVNMIFSNLFFILEIPDVYARYLLVLIFLIIVFLLRNKYRAISGLILIYIIITLFFSMIKIF